MDSNVPKYTNSHKFFQASFVGESSIISVEKIVKQLLISTLDSCHQGLDLQFDRQIVAEILDTKIALLTPKFAQLRLAPEQVQYLFTVKSIPLGYGCPLGLLLAAYWQISLRETIDNLCQFLVSTATSVPSFQLGAQITPSGWLNFYLDSSAVADWLERSRSWMAAIELPATVKYPLCQTPKNLFPVQYIYARCCSLLRLGARENLIILHQNWHSANCLIAEPEAIWLNSDNRLCLDKEAEYQILRQLLIVADAWQGETNVDWFKIAWELSRTTAIFQANCRFLGKVKCEPQKAIARLGLLDLVRSWLYLILQVKLKIASPMEL